MTKNFGAYISSAIGLSIFAMLAFGIAKWLSIPVGDFKEWAIAIVSIWWLILIVTIPWDIYFQTKYIIDQADESKKKDIDVDKDDIKYVKKVKNIFFLIAILLHVGSAIGFYFLSHFQLTKTGYLGAILAIALMGLRPILRVYKYLKNRLLLINRKIKYPREDIIELRKKFVEFEDEIKYLKRSINPEKGELWVKINSLSRNLDRLTENFNNLTFDNNKDHQEIKRFIETNSAQLSKDGQFLDNIKEIVRFFKNV